MAFSGIQATVDFYTVQESQLTNDLTDILTKINRATKNASEVTQQTSTAKEQVESKYDADSTKYKTEMSQIEDNYEMKLSEITSWESELETQKSEKETELQACTSYKQSYQSMLKQNVQSDFKYAQSSGGS